MWGMDDVFRHKKDRVHLGWNAVAKPVLLRS